MSNPSSDYQELIHSLMAGKDSDLASIISLAILPILFLLLIMCIMIIYHIINHYLRFKREDEQMKKNQSNHNQLDKACLDEVVCQGNNRNNLKSECSYQSACDLGEGINNRDKNEDFMEDNLEIILASEEEDVNDDVDDGVENNDDVDSD